MPASIASSGSAAPGRIARRRGVSGAADGRNTVLTQPFTVLLDPRLVDEGSPRRICRSSSTTTCMYAASRPTRSDGHACPTRDELKASQPGSCTRSKRSPAACSRRATRFTASGLQAHAISRQHDIGQRSEGRPRRPRERYQVLKRIGAIRAQLVAIIVDYACYPPARAGVVSQIASPARRSMRLKLHSSQHGSRVRLRLASTPAPPLQQT
jgi:hypothetical protein